LWGDFCGDRSRKRTAKTGAAKLGPGQTIFKLTGEYRGGGFEFGAGKKFKMIEAPTPQPSSSFGEEREEDSQSIIAFRGDQHL